MRKYINDGRVGVLTAVLLFFVLLFPLTKPFPYSDDWSYIHFLVEEGPPDLSWLFSLHNDHRIPLQKLLHIGLLNLTGGDFRILVAANVITIAATAMCWIAFSRLIRNESSWSEWIVPGVLLGFGFNTVAWGFSFQFLSSLFFLSIANLTWARSVRAGCKDLGAKSFLALALCSLCGGNGLITSIVVGAGFFCGLITIRGIRGLSWNVKSSMAVWGFTVAAILTNWKASAASEAAVSGAGQYLFFAMDMTKSWLGIFAIQSAAVKVIVATITLLTAIAGSAILMIRGLRKQQDCASFLLLLPVLLSALQAAALILVVTISRAGAQPWFPGLELHYGYLVTALPLSAWIVISILPNKSIRLAGLSALTLIVCIAFVANASWRTDAARAEYRRGVAATADILSSLPTGNVAHRNIREFYWVDGDEAESAVSEGLSLLRRTSFWKQRNAQ